MYFLDSGLLVIQSMGLQVYMFIVPILQMTKWREGNYSLSRVSFVPDIGIGASVNL